MAFRGRGRGRGGYGFGFEHRHGNHAPFVPYPEDIQLPEAPTTTKEDAMLIRRKFMLENFWKGSCYFLTEDGPKSRTLDAEIQRYSDTLKQGSQRRREMLASYLKLTPSNFPAELVQGAKRVHCNKKRLRWDPNSERLDHFEKLEAVKSKDGDANKEDNNEEDEDKTDEEEEEKEESDLDDYNQNIDFDDDEDDLNEEAEENVDMYDVD